MTDLFKCYRCNNDFETLRALKIHLSKQTQHRCDNTCYICGFKPEKESFYLLEHHIMGCDKRYDINGVDKCQCFNCKKPFADKRAILIHITKSKHPCNLMCYLCGQQLSNVKQYKNHKQICTGHNTMQPVGIISRDDDKKVSHNSDTGNTAMIVRKRKCSDNKQDIVKKIKVDEQISDPIDNTNGLLPINKMYDLTDKEYTIIKQKIYAFVLKIYGDTTIKNYDFNELLDKYYESTKDVIKRYVSANAKLSLSLKQDQKCLICTSKLDDTLNIDHIIPIADGGGNDKTNLQALCVHCHAKKSIIDRQVRLKQLDMYPYFVSIKDQEK